MHVRIMCADRTCGLQPHHQHREQKDRSEMEMEIDAAQLPFTDPTASTAKNIINNKFHGA
jgi:hypothetical protein